MSKYDRKASGMGQSISELGSSPVCIVFIVSVGRRPAPVSGPWASGERKGAAITVEDEWIRKFLAQVDGSGEGS